MDHEYVSDTFTVGGLTVKIVQDHDPLNPLKDFDTTHFLHWHRNYSFSNDRWEDYDLFVRDRAVYRVAIDENGYTYDKPFDTPDEIATYLEREHGAVVLPVYLFDHSGLSVSTGSAHFRAWDSAGWDWGLVGLAFMTGDEIKREISVYRPGFSRTKREALTQYRTCANDKPIGDRDRKVWTEYLNTDTGEWTRDSCWWRDKVRITPEDRATAEERVKQSMETFNQYLTGDVWGYVIEGEDPDVEDSCWGFYGDEYCREAAMEEAKALWEHHQHDEEPYSPLEGAA